MDIETREFGTMADGHTVGIVSLSGGGLSAKVLTFGAILQDLRMEGVDHPLVLGSPDLDAYLAPLQYCGALVGRYANRIGGGTFTIDGVSHHADRNFLGRHTLHGGAVGSGEMIWKVVERAEDRVTLELDMPDGHMGFPGNLTVRAEISLPGDAVLRYDISATTDAPTLCNIAQHSYFRLDDGPDILGHELMVAAESYLPVDADLIPTGRTELVDGTRFDFRQSRAVGDAGIDHNLCLSTGRVALRPVARLFSPKSRIVMEIETTEPGLQVYDGAHLDCTSGLDGRSYGAHAGLALEPQLWPDAPNLSGTEPGILRPGQTYRQTTRYRFCRDAT